MIRVDTDRLPMVCAFYLLNGSLADSSSFVQLGESVRWSRYWSVFDQNKLSPSQPLELNFNLKLANFTAYCLVFMFLRSIDSWRKVSPTGRPEWEVPFNNQLVIAIKTVKFRRVWTKSMNASLMSIGSEHCLTEVPSTRWNNNDRTTIK